MAKQNKSAIAQARDSIANSAPGRAFSKFRNTLKAIANSKGGRDLGSFLSYGQVEVSNFLIHGHAAPIYPGNSSPADLQPTSTEIGSVYAAGKQNEKSVEPQQPTPNGPSKDGAQPATSIVEAHLNDIKTPEVSGPELQPDSPGHAPADSIVANHLNDIRSTPEVGAPEKPMELEIES